MNTETKVRTIVSALTALNEVLMVFGITAFEGVTEQTIYMVVSTIAMVVAWACSHWFNNDYTPEACQATGLMRAMKASNKGITTGEDFFDETDEVDEAGE